MTEFPQTQPVPGGRRPAYHYPPGMAANLLWFAFRKFKPHDPIELFQFLADRYGPLAHYRLGPEHILFLNHPEFIREILVVQNDNFVKERTVQRTKMLLGEGMITTEGAAHRTQRRAAQPAFYRQRIPAYADCMVELAARTSENWREGGTVDVASDMMDLTLNIVSRTLFGRELGKEAHGVAAAITQIMKLYHYLVLLPGVEMLVNLGVPGLSRFTAAKRTLDACVERLIEEHRNGTSPDQKSGQPDLLTLMLQDETMETSPTALRDQVITIFLAGYETVANALTWTWYLLSQNAEAERGLHGEVDLLGDRLPAYDDLPQLRYTEMVFAESLRLYPPAWAMGRRALEDFQLGQYFLPRGTTVLISQFVLHRNPEFFPEPLRFDPDRFLPAAKAARAKFTYLPFGAGPRQCIGEAFAWMEGVLVLATIAQKWRLRLAPNAKIKPQPLITLRPKYGMPMTLTKR